MKKAKFIILIMSLLHLNSLASSRALALGTNGAKTDRDFVEFIKTYIYELEQPYLVFHWFDASNLGGPLKKPQPINTVFARDYLHSKIDNYWQAMCSTDAFKNPAECKPPDQKRYGLGGTMGAGLYVSIDPMATALGYGGAYPMMLQVALPKGLRVLDIRKDLSVTLPPEIQEYIAQTYQCNISKLWEFAGVSGSFGSKKNDNCILFLRRIMKEDLKISAIIYSFGSSYFDYCGKTVTRSTLTDKLGTIGPFSNLAMVLIDDDQISGEGVKLFSAESLGGLEEKKKLKSIAMFRDHAPSGVSSSTATIHYLFEWPEVRVIEYDEASTKEWMGQNIIGCQDRPPYIPTN